MAETADWLWDRSPSGYLRATPDWQITHVNPALATMLSNRADALVGRPVSDLLDAASARELSGLAIQLRDHGARVEADLRFLTRDGTSIATQLSAVRDGEDIKVLVDPSMSRALELISALQQTLLPAAIPQIEGLEVAAAYRPALGDVGGDFYDVFEVAEGDWCIVIGDVSGKGVDAAIMTSAARHAVRSHALREPAPSGLLAALNRELCATESTRFCTVGLLRLVHTNDAWVATMTSGGHPYPLLVRHGAVTNMGEPGSLIGVFADVEFHEVSIRLAVGDVLLLYTDGVIEARNEAGEFFGDARLREAIGAAGPSVQEIVDGVLAAVLAFQPQGATDDIALVGVRRP